MRRSVTTVGSLALLLSTIMWSTTLHQAWRISTVTEIQRTSAIRVAYLWELELISIGYRYLYEVDRILQEKSGGELRDFLSVLGKNVKMNDYTRLESQNMIIEASKIETALRPWEVHPRENPTSKHFVFLNQNHSGTALYVSVHLRVMDNLTGISKTGVGLVRITHPAGVIQLLEICEQMEGRARLALERRQLIDEVMILSKDVMAAVKTSRVDNELSYSVRVWEIGVLGLFSSLKSDLVCMRQGGIMHPR